MLQRIPPSIRWFGLSAAVLAILIAVLFAPERDVGGPLVVRCADGLRDPVSAIAAAYEAETGHHIELAFGPSEQLVNDLKLSGQGDLLLPADESYITSARDKGLLADEVVSIGEMNAVLVVPSGNANGIRTWSDLTGKPMKLALAGEGAAIGRFTREHLSRTNRWEPVQRRRTAEFGTVTQVANAVATKSVDAGIVWDTVARPNPKLDMIALPELAGIEAKVQIAVTKNCRRPAAALQFARYLASSDKGLPIFRDYGFVRLATGDKATLRPSLVLHAGAMLRPAIESTLREFEEREGVEIVTVYDGCGNLVSAMKTKATPDAFFACDASFMTQVADKFTEPQTVSSNQLVIAVKKGNPHGVKTLKDLAKPGLKVGVGHEQQCALGSISKETFLKAGVYGAIAKNVVATTPTGDMLVAQLLTGSLDAVVAYRSNVLPNLDRLEYTEVTGIPCAAPTQPIAVAKNTSYPNLTRRLVRAIQSAQSRERFEANGFGWKP